MHLQTSALAQVCKKWLIITETEDRVCVLVIIGDLVTSLLFFFSKQVNSISKKSHKKWSPET